MITVAAGKSVTRSELHQIPIPARPDAGKVWAGVNHGLLADTLVNKLKKLGFYISDETWYCNRTMSGLFGSIRLSAVGSQFRLDIGTPAELSLGVRHDNSGRYAVSIAVGATIMVCSNGVFSGEFVLKSRHTHTLDIDNMVDDGVERWLADTSDLEKFIHKMQAYDLSDRQAAWIVVTAAEGNNPGSVVPWSYLRHVLHQWKEPLHDEFKPRTLWSLYNCFTEVFKQLQVPVQMDALKSLKRIVEAELN